MIVRYKGEDGHFHNCECAMKDCPRRNCFSPGHAIHSSSGGYNGAWQDKSLSCVYRDYHGCPEPRRETAK